MAQRIQRASKLFQPFNILPKDSSLKGLPKSQKLMLDYGIIKQSSNGTFHLLPLGLKVLEKLERLVDLRLRGLNAQKVKLPLLTEAQLWMKSGRLDSAVLGLYKLSDRHGREMLLGPTHEESVSELLSHVGPVSHNQLPLLLYQIGTKFRDELRPRCGLIRCKEFVMKDLYSFHESEECAKRTFDAVCKVYEDLIGQLEVPVVKAKALPGDMGGTVSNEFLVLNEIGDDLVYLCNSCSQAFNKEAVPDGKCDTCGDNLEKSFPGVEIGHTFLLGTHYSQSLKALYRPDKGPPKPMFMGSYGLGLTRIMAVCVEHLSLETEIRWPKAIAPFSLVVIPPKAGSSEDKGSEILLSQLLVMLADTVSLPENILLDDRLNMTIGKRLVYAKSSGYPMAIVIGKKSMSQPALLEVHDLYSGNVIELDLDGIQQYLNEAKWIEEIKSIVSAAC